MTAKRHSARLASHKILLALEPGLALFAEGVDTFLEVFALAHGVEQPAYFGDRFERSFGITSRVSFLSD